MNNTNNPNTNDVIVANSPADAVSSLSFSPAANILAAGCWDSKVYIWEINGQGQTQAKAAFDHKVPVLSTDFSTDGTRLFSGTCDNKAMMWSLATQQSQQVGAHQAPIKNLFWLNDVNLLVTGGWDKKLMYWDLRQQTPSLTVDLPDRVYAMDVTYPLMVVGCGGKDRNVCIFNLKQPQRPHLTKPSYLKYQTRCIANFPDQKGFAIGSIEGRVAIMHIQDSKGKDFAFKCHRNKKEVYAVNSLCFHKRLGTFATAGSDGTYVFWDKDSKQRLNQFQGLPNSITATAMSKDNNIFAYSMGYDWSQGQGAYQQRKAPNAIYLHPITGKEFQPKPRT